MISTEIVMTCIGIISEILSMINKYFPNVPSGLVTFFFSAVCFLIQRLSPAYWQNQKTQHEAAKAQIIADIIQAKLNEQLTKHPLTDKEHDELTERLKTLEDVIAVNKANSQSKLSNV